MMENLNVEAVKKELEGLANFRTCPEYIKDALALITLQEERIKELAEENAEVKANWQKLKESHESACEECRAEFNRLTEENERLKQKRMNKIDIYKALDILDKFDFFQGQRAGRELWSEKPFEVQEEDLKKFSMDVELLKDFVEDIAHKLKCAELQIEAKERICESYMLQYGTATDKEVWLKKERAETVKKMQSEIQERCIKGGIYPAFVKSKIDQIAREKLEGEK